MAQSFLSKATIFRNEKLSPNGGQFFVACLFICLCVCLSVCLCLSPSLHVYIYMDMYVYIYICEWTYVYLCIYRYICIYVYIISLSLSLSPSSPLHLHLYLYHDSIRTCGYVYNQVLSRQPRYRGVDAFASFCIAIMLAFEAGSFWARGTGLACFLNNFQRLHRVCRGSLVRELLGCR